MNSQELKSLSGTGEWQNEPDRLEWIDELSGYPCLARRNMHLGNWCGYVGIPSSHKYYRKIMGDKALDSLDVYWGVTYTDKCDGDPENGICHKSEKDDIWWIGFDCAHCDDYIPWIEANGHHYNFPNSINVTYKTLEFVKKECESLAKQLKEKEQQDE